MIVIADAANGATWARYPQQNPIFYSMTVANVTSNTRLELTAPYPGTGTTGTALFYNPVDPQWNGADGGTGLLGSMLYPCSVGPVPCSPSGSDFVPKYRKSLGMGSGAGDVPLALGMLVNAPASCGPPQAGAAGCVPALPRKQ
jgi:hypothetical protein